MNVSRRHALVSKSVLFLALGMAVIPGLAVAQGPTSTNPVMGSPPWPGRYPYTRADVEFIAGMISHHAQAIDMCGLAPTNGANRSVGILCRRIINAQTDEIHIFQQWLKDRNQAVPEAKAVPMKMTMNGVEHEMLMPGMLTDEQMAELRAAQGVDFDRTFLKYMIGHHQGAIDMVNVLMSAPGAAQDDAVYKVSSDVFADQTAEIDRMTQMLNAL